MFKIRTILSFILNFGIRWNESGELHSSAARNPENEPPVPTK